MTRSTTGAGQTGQAPGDFHWPAHLAVPGGAGLFGAMMKDAPAGGARVRFSFGAGYPPAEFYPVEWLKKSFHALLRDAGAGAFNYGPVEGLPSLRALIARNLRADGVEASEGNVFVTYGAQQAIALAAHALVEPGDTVAVEEPTYPGALSVLRERRAGIVGIPMEQDGLNLDAVEAVCRRRTPKLLYTTPDFHNPTGRVLSLAKREKLMRLAERYGLPVLEDGTFRELRYHGESLPPVKAFDRSGLVIFVNSVSKKIAPALRVGWAVVHPDLAERLAAIKAAEDLGTGAFCQTVLEKFFVRGYYPAHLRRVRRAYAERLEAMWGAIGRRFPPEAVTEKPDGGMFLWVTFPDGVDLGEALAECRRRGLVFSPGSLFYPAARGRNQMRLSFAAHSPREIEAGIRLLGEAAAVAIVGSVRSGGTLKGPIV